VKTNLTNCKNREQSQLISCTAKTLSCCPSERLTAAQVQKMIELPKLCHAVSFFKNDAKLESK